VTWQQLLLVIVCVVILGVAVIVGFSLFSASAVASNRDSIVSDLSDIAGNAYRFYGRLRVMGGGQGDYSTYSIPRLFAANDNATYSIKEVSADSVKFLAVSASDPSNTVAVTLNGNGKLANWTFSGDFQ
jgi:hypothetical protein